MMEKAGHEVIPFSIRYSRNLYSQWEKYFVSPISGEGEVTFKEHSWNIKSFKRALSRAFSSKEVYQSVKELIKVGRPDLAFVLHYLRKLSPSVLVAIKEANLPLIVRLSDFAMLCPGAHFLRDNEVCELCKGGKLWPSIRYRCVQGSIGASVVNTLATIYHRYKGYFELIDAFIIPTLFMKNKMIEGGWPEDKINHIPTFVDLEHFKPNEGKRQQIISYTGRIHPTKGIEILVDAFKIVQANDQYKSIKLMVAGDEKTYESEKLKKYINENDIRNVEFTGQLDGQGISKLLSNSLFSVTPSLCYENMPNAVLESMACGTPVIASNIGCFPEILGKDDIGVLFKVGDAKDLADNMAFLLSDPERLGIISKQARRVAEREYNGELHYQRLMNVFDKVMQQQR